MSAGESHETIHLVTGEYPPDRGGVSGYTSEVARALANDGAVVHVWCPGQQPALLDRGIHVHRSLGRISAADLRRAGIQLDAIPRPRRLIVQWVPHAFGRRSMNVAFCRWVAARNRDHGDTVEVMVHEPYLDYTRSPRRIVSATVHRAMMRTLLRTASRVWVSTPAWEARCRPYARHWTTFDWLPIPSTIPVCELDRSLVDEVRRSFVPRGGCIVGSFSPAGSFVPPVLAAAAAPVVAAHPDTALLLIGNGSEDARDILATLYPAIARRIHATGSIHADAVACQLAACDLAVQPCPDGVCTRHSSVATLLAHGIPVVTTGGRLTEPLWAESSGVALSPPGDLTVLRRLIEHLVGDPAERRALAMRGAALYEARLHVRHTVAAFRTRAPAFT